MNIYGVRPEFRDQLFSVVIDVISSIPPPTRKCRRLNNHLYFITVVCAYM